MKKGLAEQVKEACGGMVASGLLKEAGDGSEGGKKKTGRQVGRYRKAAWDEVRGDQTALDEWKRLELSRDTFDR